VNWISHINLASPRINRDRGMIVKLAVAVAFAAPHPEYPSIRSKFDDSRAALVDDIHRVIRANGDPARSVESGIWPLPLVNDSSVGCQLLDSMLGSVRRISIASPIDCDPVRCA